jgi:hypothetical protein
MHRLPLFQRFLIIALCAAGLVACERNVEVPTLMPTLPAPAQATPAKPAAPQPAGEAAPTQPAAKPTAPVIAATPITATQVILDAAVTPGTSLSGADLDQALAQYQQDLTATDMGDGTNDSLEVNADQALNQFGQSLDNTDTLSDVVIKSAP